MASDKSATDDEVQLTIRAVVESSVEKWQKFLSTHEGEFVAAIHREYDRYKIWAGSIGVYARSPVSADDRLKADSTLYQMTVDIVSDLSEHLTPKDADATSSDESSSSDPDSDEETQELKSTMKEQTRTLQNDRWTEVLRLMTKEQRRILRDVRSCISQLYSILSLVRQPRALVDAAVYTDDDIIRDMGMDIHQELIQNYSSHIDWHLNVLLPRQSSQFQASEVINDRLLDACIHRRKALLRRHRHNRKIKGEVGKAFASTQKQDLKTVSPSQAHLSSSMAGGKSVAATTQVSSTVVSTPQNDTSTSDSAREGHTSSLPSKSVVAQQKGLDIPPPPLMPPGHTEFTCYVCGLSTLTREDQYDERWR